MLFINLIQSMRVWRNWQTHQPQELALQRAGSSPVTRTIILLVLWCSWLTCQSVTLEIAGSSPVGTAILNAPVVQLDRILDYGSRGWGFESSRACHFNLIFIFSGLSSAWQSIWFGTRGSQVRILQSRPFKQVQFNGRTPAFQAGYAGSIPVTCSIFFKIYRSSKKRIYFLFLQGILVNYGQNTLFFYTFMKHLDFKTIGD